VKLVLILMLAKHFSGQGEREDASLSDIVKAGLIAGVPMLLVLKQLIWEPPNLRPGGAHGLFLGGIQYRHAATILLIAGVLMPTLWIYGPRMHLVKQYQKDRLTSFLHPEADSQKTGYQLEQSKIAVDRVGFGAKACEKARKHRGHPAGASH